MMATNLLGSFRLYIGRTAHLATWLLIGACGGRSGGEPSISGTGGGAPWNTNIAGAWNSATGGAWAVPTGGAPWVTATGGARVLATGGASWITAAGGAWTLVTGGASWVTATGGSSGSISCAKVTCGSIPDTCKQVIQEPNACCPVCLDTGCPPCADVVCVSGTHLETPAGACCPECVTDPPDPCVQGQQSYASLRATLLTKYGSLGCSNSTDCVIVPEQNLCAWTCGNPLPSSMYNNLQMNLSSNALSFCVDCSPPTQVLCEAVVAACVNGKCVAASPSP